MLLHQRSLAPFTPTPSCRPEHVLRGHVIAATTRGRFRPQTAALGKNAGRKSSPCVVAHVVSWRALGAVAARECDGSAESKATLILYSKPGCHLCEGLEEKLREAIAAGVLGNVEEIVVRDISTNTEWWLAFQLEVPVMSVDLGDGEKQLPRQSPRLSAERVGKAVHKEIEALLGGHAKADAASVPGGGNDPFSLQPVDWRNKQ